MHIAYIEKRLSAERLTIIQQAKAILDEYARQGFDLTLRQLYYQFVSRDLIPNNMQSYKRLGDIVSDGRMCGLIDWNRIVDRTRHVARVSHWDTPSDIILAAAQSFRLDKWEAQPYRVEVWIEKDALSGVIDGICRQLDISYLSCRGYTSQSEMWSSAMRYKSYGEAGQNVLILHLGDHDPSGIDMTRDIADRLNLFCGYDVVEVKRIALNWNQVEQYNPPPNPAKLTDSRVAGYLDRFGASSWELDALQPRTITELIQDEVFSVRDVDLWTEAVEEEELHRELLLKASKGWDRIANTL